MSQTTRCPACNVHFKVVADQLRIADGWVRCGECSQVFDATHSLESLESQSLLPDLHLDNLRGPVERTKPRPVPARTWKVASAKAAQTGGFAFRAEEASTGPTSWPSADEQNLWTDGHNTEEPARETLRQKEVPGNPEPGAPAQLVWRIAAAKQRSPATEWGQLVSTLQPGAAPTTWRVPLLAQSIPLPPLQTSETSTGGGFAENLALSSPAREIPVQGGGPAALAWPSPDEILGNNPAGALISEAPVPAAYLEDAGLPRGEARKSGSLDAVSVAKGCANLQESFVTVGVPRASLAGEQLEPALQAERPRTAAFGHVPEHIGVEPSYPPDPEHGWADGVPRQFPAGYDKPTGELVGAFEDAELSAAPIAEPAFVRQAKRRAFWKEPRVRIPLLLCGLGLGFLLAGQVAFNHRDLLAANFPQARPLLAGICELLGCVVSPHRDIGAISVEGSSFNHVRGDQYKFLLTLRNRTALEVRAPLIELTLTDIQDQPVVRRVLTADELALPAALQNQQEWSGEMPVTIAPGTARIAGFRMLAFYPN